MKQFNELTNEEIYALTAEELQKYKKLALAENGVKFPVQPVKPIVEKREKDKVVYIIEGLSEHWGDVCFESAVDAQKFLDYVTTFKGLGYKKRCDGSDYNTYYAESGLPKGWRGEEQVLHVQAERVYSKEAYKEYAKEIKDNIAQNKKYERDLAEYNEVYEKARTLTAFITDKYCEVCEDINEKKRLASLLKDEYLPLADGDVDVAMKFLDKTYSLSDEQKEYVLAHYND